MSSVSTSSYRDSITAAKPYRDDVTAVNDPSLNSSSTINNKSPTASKKRVITYILLLAFIGAVMVAGKQHFANASASAAAVPSSPVCPGSPARVHAKCQMKVHFPDSSCSSVVEEINLRLDSAASNWVDPHNQGTYKLLQSTTSDDGNGNEQVLLEVSRQSGGLGKYTDLLNLQLTTDGDACMLEACSESQVTSILDFSTNYCSLRNLYCGDSGCNPIQHTFTTYDETYEDCSQRTVSKCVA